MEQFDVVVIGSGLGGLLSAHILAKEGYKVCVLEKNDKIGGCLQIFARDKCIFNTGLNYTEGLSKGQILHTYFSYLGIVDKLKIKQLDVDGFEVITYKGKEYMFAQGDEKFIETLSTYFPEEKKAIRTYVEKIKSICNQFPLYNLDIENPEHIDFESLFSESAHDYLTSITNNTDLQNVLAGNNLLYAGVKDKTPLYIQALITYTFISSSWRLVDGSQQLASIIAQNIKNAGGIIYRNSEVKTLHIENTQIQYAELTDGRKIKATHYISNIHPINTIALTDSRLFTNAFRKRIAQLENTISTFSIYIVLKEKAFPYQNFNHYIYNNDDVWTASNYAEAPWPQSCLLYTPAISKPHKYADGLIGITFMTYDEVKEWAHTSVEDRGEAYLIFKKQKAELLIDLIEKKIPDIRKMIKTYYTSTPLTYRDYTGTPNGSAYGILKDFNNPFKTLITPKSKISNLYFTGQNLNVHGILGVTIGAVMTCGEIVGLPYLLAKIKADR